MCHYEPPRAVVLLPHESIPLSGQACCWTTSPMMHWGQGFSWRLSSPRSDLGTYWRCMVAQNPSLERRVKGYGTSISQLKGRTFQEPSGGFESSPPLQIQICDGKKHCILARLNSNIYVLWRDTFVSIEHDSNFYVDVILYRIYSFLYS